METDQPQKSVLITGAGKRIGAALSAGLGADGWHVYVHYNSSATEAMGVVESISSSGGSAEAVEFDFAGDLELPRLLDSCPLLTTGISCLINNASVFQYDTPADFSAEGWSLHQRVNLDAPVALSRAYHALRTDESGGHIINLLDNKIFNLNPDFFSYTISKSALYSATELMAMFYAPKVRVNGIAPGITLLSGKQTEESFRHAHTTNPMHHGVNEEDILATVRYILSTRALCGEIITVDAGQRLLSLKRDVAFLSEEDSKNDQI
jgi:NAD(P)-dependent dehydrogenase (short-subunit alcohol dehydrogenase family)